jgi:hypothetical protein
VAMLLHHYDMTLDKKPEEIWISGMMRPGVNIKYKQREIVTA